MSWFVQYDGKLVTMPMFAPGDPRDWIVPTLEGRFPNTVMLTMDEDRFKRGFMKHAMCTRGRGEYATLAYCAGRLTIHRHTTLDKAIEAKRAIDGGGCGGGCGKVHVIVQVDPTNSRHAQEQENIRRYVSQQAKIAGDRS
jgi:hypothetical protein